MIQANNFNLTHMTLQLLQRILFIGFLSLDVLIDLPNIDKSVDNMIPKHFDFYFLNGGW